MLIACKVKKEKANIIPAVVHVDNSCRVQSVSKKLNSKFWKLINEFEKITKIPVVLNTSFNVKGEPIVNDSDDLPQFHLVHSSRFHFLDNHFRFLLYSLYGHYNGKHL